MSDHKIEHKQVQRTLTLPLYLVVVVVGVVVVVVAVVGVVVVVNGGTYAGPLQAVVLQ